MATLSKTCGYARCTAAVACLLLVLQTGCGSEPTERKVLNGRSFEALLSAIVLKDSSELEKDAKTIEDRRQKGELSAGNYERIAPIIKLARSGDWTGAEKTAYEFRARFGDAGAYFD